LYSWSSIVRCFYYIISWLLYIVGDRFLVFSVFLCSFVVFSFFVYLFSIVINFVMSYLHGVTLCPEFCEGRVPDKHNLSLTVTGSDAGRQGLLALTAYLWRRLGRVVLHNLWSTKRGGGG
jgi:hypothetical protein